MAGRGISEIVTTTIIILLSNCIYQNTFTAEELLRNANFCFVHALVCSRKLVKAPLEIR